jgi:hypothetical protein
MKNSFKHLLVAILVLAAVVLPVIGSANSYKATETTESTEVEIGTQGVLTAANMYDWNFGCYNDIIVFMSYDDTQTLSTLTGQTEGDSFAWFYNFMLEYNAEKGVWVVTKADMEMGDSANQLRNETLGEGKMIVMFHDLVTTKQQESYDFFMNTVEVGAEFYLGIHPDYIYDVYDYVDGAFLSTVPVEVEAPEVEDTTTEDATTEDTTTDTEDKDDAKGVNPIIIVAAVVVVLAIVGVVIVVAKRKKAE